MCDEFNKLYGDRCSDLENQSIFGRLVENMCVEHVKIGMIFIPLTNFTYNNSLHFSIEMTLLEYLYGRRCKTSLFWFKSRDMLLLRQMLHNRQARDDRKR